MGPGSTPRRSTEMCAPVSKIHWRGTPLTRKLHDGDPTGLTSIASSVPSAEARRETTWRFPTAEEEGEGGMQPALHWPPCPWRVFPARATIGPRGNTGESGTLAPAQAAQVAAKVAVQLARAVGHTLGLAEVEVGAPADSCSQNVRVGRKHNNCLVGLPGQRLGRRGCRGAFPAPGRVARTHCWAQRQVGPELARS